MRSFHCSASLFPFLRSEKLVHLPLEKYITFWNTNICIVAWICLKTICLPPYEFIYISSFVYHWTLEQALFSFHLYEISLKSIFVKHINICHPQYRFADPIQSKLLSWQSNWYLFLVGIFFIWIHFVRMCAMRRMNSLQLAIKTTNETNIEKKQQFTGISRAVFVQLNIRSLNKHEPP